MHGFDMYANEYPGAAAAVTTMASAEGFISAEGATIIMTTKITLYKFTYY